MISAQIEQPESSRGAATAGSRNSAVIVSPPAFGPYQSLSSRWAAALDGDGWLQHHLATPFGATPPATPFNKGLI
jgi:hypothetical protein